MNPNPHLTKLQQLGVKYAFYWRQTGKNALFFANCERFRSASLIKVPILLAWLRLEQAGALSRSELCNLDDEPQVQGAGLSWLLQTRQIPYADALLLMIALSDNLCTNLVLRRIGLERLEQVFQDELGLKGSLCQRKLMDSAARERGLDNWVTAQDCIRFYDLIHQLPAQDLAWAESLLGANSDGGLLLRSIPRDTLTFFHKTGSLPGVLHDWGYTRRHEIFLLTQGVQDEIAVAEIFGQLGQALLE